MAKEYNLKKICTSFILGFIIFAVALYFIAGDSFQYKVRTSSSIDPSAVVGKITTQAEVTQPFTIDADCITSYSLRFGLFGHENHSLLTLDIYGSDGSLLAENQLQTDNMTEYEAQNIELTEPIVGHKGEKARLVIRSDADDENAVSVYYGNSISLARGSVTQDFSEDEKAVFTDASGSTTMDGILCMTQTSKTDLWFGHYYWLLAACVLAILCIYAAILMQKSKSGKKSATINFIRSINRYEFLIHQLVSRDFKTKYRRSVLGVFWSFLNPLLTMLVQYVVFSTLFKSSIPHYPAYLLSGIVLFNFFSETTTVGMTSITANAPLITKVYVPKYIYPLTRMLSSTINVALSFLPLFLVTIVTGVFPAFSWLLLLYVLACLMAFALGISYILSTLMVYFRDTQFLWTVISMIWMYCTPIFYPESIIPANLLKIYHLNPLYQIVSFARTALIDRVSPEPMAYLVCLLVAVVPLVIGIWVFNRKEKDFVLYL